MGGLHTLLIIVIALLVLLFLVSAGLCTYAVFPKRFGLDETRKIELGKAYLKGTEFPAKEVYTVSSYDGYILHAEYIETDPQSKKFVIISHGYTYTRYGSYKYVYLFQKLGFNCIIYDDRDPGVERPSGDDRGHLSTVWQRDLSGAARGIYGFRIKPYGFAV